MGKKAVVIGAGIGGCACAALLAQGGHEVTLLESQAFPGGRCASQEKDGFRYDFGVHMFSMGDAGPHGEVSRRIGGNLRWVARDPACRVLGKADFSFPLDIKPLPRLAGLAGKLGVRVKSLPGAFRLFRALLKGRTTAATDAMTLKDYASSYTRDESVHLFLNCVSQLYFALAYNEASAGEFLYSFSRMFGMASFAYPVGGSGAIPSVLLEGLERRNGRVLFHTPVQRIRVQDGRVRGVETCAGELPADLVVSNAGLWRTIELAGRDHFPAAYLRKAESYRPSNSYVTVKYALNRAVIPDPVVFYMPDLPPAEVFRYIAERSVPEDPYIFMPVPSHHDPTLAPPGRQLVVAGTAAPPEASDILCNAILDRVHAKVRELFPALESAVLWQSRSTCAQARELTGHRAGEAIGLAQTPDQSGRLRPGWATPVEGLWLVGADAGARGIGTEMAAASALGLAERLLAV